MPTFFLLLRVTIGLMIAAALGVLLLIVLLRSGAAFLKESVGVLGYVVRLFTSGFTKGTPPGKPAGWVVSFPQAGLAILFVVMMVSLFHPEETMFLHIIAGLTAVTVIWYGRMLLTGVKLEIFCLPLLVVWFCYYGMCLFWSGNQPGVAVP